jgi:hypothetical protein
LCFLEESFPGISYGSNPSTIDASVFDLLEDGVGNVVRDIAVGGASHSEDSPPEQLLECEQLVV